MGGTQGVFGRRNAERVLREGWCARDFAPPFGGKNGGGQGRIMAKLTEGHETSTLSAS